jgi:DNA-binding LytR/AlgR family response regulator
MQQYNCIIIEDEPLASEILQDYIADVPFLNLKHTYPDAVRALEGLRAGNIDLIFLDINLPKLKGLDFIQTLKHPPNIIITTAYHEYALQGYELNVVDYLLKPIEFSRFLKSVNKLKSVVSDKARTAPIFIGDSRDHLFVNAHGKKVKLYFKDILYIESLKEYVRIYTTEKILTAKFQLGQIDELLPKAEFLRIHRSFIVSKSKIEAYNRAEVEINGKPLPIGRSYKELVISFLDGETV